MQVINLDIFGDDKTELSKVIEALKLQLSENEIEGIDRITIALRDYALGDIKKIIVGNNVLASFILCSCFIEQVATYRYGTQNVGHPEFKRFIDEYLVGYDGRLLRADLRNKLVHNYSLGETYSLTMQSRDAHLREATNGSIILNLENFVEDLERALQSFLHQLVTDPNVRRLAFKVLSKNHIVGMSNIDYINTNHPDLIQ
jgi:hypothetical protein